MPLFPRQAAKKIADKHMETARFSTTTSIRTKVSGSEKELSVEESIKLAKTQKKDSMYDTDLRIIVAP